MPQPLRALLVLAVVAYMQFQARAHIVVVTGATGRTGSAVFGALRARGVQARALVRDVEKARDVLGCWLCDVSEGIYVGDITSEVSVMPVMRGADTLVITTGVGSNEVSKDILFDGVRNQVAALLNSWGPRPQDRHVVLLSMMEDLIEDASFNALRGEAYLMNALVPFTVVKACTLDEDPAGRKRLLAERVDWQPPGSRGGGEPRSVSREDVARVLVAAAMQPALSARLRFNLCTDAFGTQRPDVSEVFHDVMYPWDPRRRQAKEALAPSADDTKESLEDGLEGSLPEPLLAVV